MRVPALVDRVELADFEFSDKIWMRGARWRVLRMTYDANVEGLVKVECLKVLSDVAICEDTPTGLVVKDNVITFNNSATDYGSQTCCELYGYQWVQFVEGGVGYQRCKPRPQTTQPT